MARVSYCLPFSRFSGRPATSTGRPPFVCRATAETPRTQLTPHRSFIPSPSQSLVQAAVRTVTHAWDSLNPTRATAWRSFARQVTFRNAVGSLYSPSGFNAFRWINQPFVISGFPVQPDPPSGTSPPANPEVLFGGAIIIPTQIDLSWIQHSNASWLRVLAITPWPSPNRRMTFSDAVMLDATPIVPAGTPGGPNHHVFPFQFHAIDPPRGFAFAFTLFTSDRFPAKTYITDRLT